MNTEGILWCGAHRKQPQHIYRNSSLAGDQICFKSLDPEFASDVNNVVQVSSHLCFPLVFLLSSLAKKWLGIWCLDITYHSSITNFIIDSRCFGSYDKWMCFLKITVISILGSGGRGRLLGLLGDIIETNSSSRGCRISWGHQVDTAFMLSPLKNIFILRSCAGTGWRQNTIKRC